ncbi:hypothetical protein FKM82_018696 [Ascaphus truei]
MYRALQISPVSSSCVQSFLNLTGLFFTCTELSTFHRSLLHVYRAHRSLLYVYCGFSVEPTDSVPIPTSPSISGTW